MFFPPWACCSFTPEWCKQKLSVLCQPSCAFILIKPACTFKFLTELVITLSCLMGSYGIGFLIPYCKEKAKIILYLISSLIAGTSVLQTMSSTHIYWSCLSFTSVHLCQNAIMLYHQGSTIRSNCFKHIPCSTSQYSFLTQRRKSKHLKSHLASRMSNVKFLDQRVIRRIAWVMSHFWIRGPFGGNHEERHNFGSEGHLAHPVSNITFLDQRAIRRTPWLTSRFWIRGSFSATRDLRQVFGSEGHLPHPVSNVYGSECVRTSHKQPPQFSSIESLRDKSSQILYFTGLHILGCFWNINLPGNTLDPLDILWAPGGHCYLWQSMASEGITNGKSGNEII